MKITASYFVTCKIFAPCSHCNKSFRILSDFKNHQSRLTGEKPHECLQCGKSFATLNDLRAHEKRHVKEKLHKCTHCYKSFKLPRDVKAHVKRHAEVKHPDKSEKYFSIFNFQLRNRKGIEQYECDYCSNKFSAKKYLIDHIKGIHSSKSLKIILLRLNS